MKTKIFKTLAAALAVSSMLASSGGQVYAAVDSTKDVATPSTESCNVSATLETLWSVNIPKHVTLDTLCEVLECPVSEILEYVPPEDI